MELYVAVLVQLSYPCMCLVGAVHYGRNGHHVASLMHVDHTLPMWAFFDVYGSIQKIKLLGKIGRMLTCSSSCLTSLRMQNYSKIKFPKVRIVEMLQ